MPKLLKILFKMLSSDVPWFLNGSETDSKSQQEVQERGCHVPNSNYGNSQEMQHEQNRQVGPRIRQRQQSVAQKLLRQREHRFSENRSDDNVHE